VRKPIRSFKDGLKEEDEEDAHIIPDAEYEL
jgi:hypothetical protein